MINIKYRATIETKEITYDYSKDIANNAEEVKADNIGKFPMMYINGIQIDSKHIQKMIISNNKFLPNIYIEFVDTSQQLIMDKFPVDESIVSIFKKSTSSGVMDLKMDFKILNFKIINGVSGTSVTFKLYGILNADPLYLFHFEAYKDTTYNVLDKLSNDMKFGFVSNISNTNDEQSWINPGDFRLNFLKDIVSHSYIDDTTFLFGYIDFYYNFNYVDINKQLKSDISEQMNVGTQKELNKDCDDNVTPLILTNIDDANSTNMFIDKYTVFQDSTEINIENGYRYRYSGYDKTEDHFKRYFLDSITDSDTGIVLKGNPYTTDGILYEESISEKWMGKFDTYNVHTNFLQSELYNENNLNFLQKLKIVIKLKKPNFTLYRFQKLLLELYNLKKFDTLEESNKQKDDISSIDYYDSKIIHALSGEWLITAINYKFENGANEQEITLVKRELTETYNFPRRKKNKK